MPVFEQLILDRASLFFEFACDQAGAVPTSSDLQRALRWVIVDALTIDVGAQAWTCQSFGSDRLVQGVTFLPSAAGRVRIAVHTTMHDLVGRSADSDFQGSDGAPEFCITGAQGPIPLDLTLDLP